jgi:hypothetical protein
MNNRMLSELKSACQAEPSLSDRETIARGVSTWFHGRATHAPDGTIALAMSDDVKVIIAESDVRSVTKENDIYRVEVSAESNFLLRLEKVMKATVDGGCDNEDEPPTSLAKDAVKDKPRKGELTIGDVTVCTLRCTSFTIFGKKFEFCFPVNCKTYPAPS